MAFSHPVLEMLFLGNVIIIWGMIFYQLFFTFLGLLYHIRSIKEKNEQVGMPLKDFPGVSILIPAHNEEIVMENTLKSLLALDYPKDKIEIIVINDGSTDNTAQIVQRIQQEQACVKLYNVPIEESARGKSHALNLGLKQARYSLIAIYDADNTPEAASLKYLVSALVQDEKLGATFGKFRPVNRNRNLLTRFINLETLSFQFMIQGGRYLISRIAILPGTNFLIRKEVVELVGGWDEDALTEDMELSIRLYERGYEIKYVPYALTWEQEPEAWGTWLRQRTRWVRGNFYVLKKYLLPSVKWKKLTLFFELLYLFVLYYLFLGAILLSHLFFIFAGSGLIALQSPGPYFVVWLCAFLLFTVEIMLAVSFEKENTWKNFLVVCLMYFIYCQGWIVLVFRALYQEKVLRGKIKWEKTKRFAS